MLSDVAVRRPVTTSMFFLAMAMLGLISWTRLPVQLFPELIFPEVFVSLVLPGASPEQIERELVIPTEAEIGKLEGIQEIESFALANTGGVRVSYAPDVDMKFALLQLENRVNRLLPGFPQRTSATVRRFDSSDLSSSVMQLHVLGEGDLNWLRDFTEEEIRPKLESIDGVVNAEVMGGRQSAVEIILNPLLLQAHRLTVGQVRSRINAFNRRREYLGRVFDGEQAYSVSVQGQFQDLKEIQDLVLKPEIPLRLGDVSKVRYGLQEQTTRHRVNGKPSVGIRIQKDDEANLIEVAEAVESALVRLNEEFKTEGVELGVSSSQAELMNEALSTLKQAAVVGAILGLIVLFFFLRNFRFVSVLILAIPVSLLITFNLMFAWDLSINVLSLCGLALAVGMLTDNGIVVMESIFKHFEEGKSAGEAARQGTADVSRAVVASTATTVTVFLPVVFIQSDAQDLLRELALSMTFPLLASLLVALTLVPALAARTLTVDTPRPPGAGSLMEKYTLILKACLRHRVLVTLGIGAAVVITLVVSLFYMLQQEVRREETRFTVYVDLPEGATLEATDEVVGQVESAVKELDGMDRFTTSVQESQASLTVMLHNRSDRPGEITLDEIKSKLDERTQTIAGGVVGYQPKPRAGRGGGGRGVGVRRHSSGGFNLAGGTISEQMVVRGYDFTTLKMLADDLVFRLQELEEVDPNSVRPDVERGASEVQVIPNAEAMFDRGLRVADVLNAVGDARVDGFRTTVPFLADNSTEVPVEVRTTENASEVKYGLADLKESKILNATGEFVPLDEVSRVRTDAGRSSILRTDQSRRIVVNYQFPDEVLDSQPRLDAARDIVTTTVRDMLLPPGYTVEIVEAEEDTIYYWMMGVAAILVYMILASLFESFSSPIIILCTLPPAVVGSCWALMMSGTGLSQQEGPMALLGFIVLVGIAVNNGIILIDAIGTLRTKRGFRRERAVLTAGRSRVRPILMTSATTLLGVLPLALKFGGDFEIWPPFAITVLGGLTVSMFSTLIFIPVVYMGLDQVKTWLEDIGFVGVALATLAAAAGAYGTYTRYESLFWGVLVLLPFWIGCLGLVWSVIRVHRARVAASFISQPVNRIQIRNLTKIYGAPGRFRRDWARYERRKARNSDVALDPQERKALIDSLSWKIPLTGLLLYFSTYFEDGLWIYLHALAMAAQFTHLGRCVSSLWKVSFPTWCLRTGRIIAPRILPVAFLVYIHIKLNLPSVTAASSAAWLLFLLLTYLGKRMKSRGMNLDNLSGRFAWLRKLVYRGVAALPVVGVARPEFQALAGVDLDIRRGMFGLLGPNGAGKTTLMRILCQVLEPSYGSVIIEGKNLMLDGRVQGLIGYLPQHFGYYAHLSAYDFLDYRALLEGFKDGVERNARVLECLEQVNLRDRMDDPVGSFSGGMRQRVGIAQTLLHMPQVIVVDEPTAGLDPMERIRFRNLLATVSQDRIVVFSTHIVEDISGSCNNLAVLDRGQVLYTGSPLEMRELAQDRTWESVLAEERFLKAESHLQPIAHMRTPDGVRVRYLSDDPSPDLDPVLVDPTLEDAYLYLLRRGRIPAC
jgi:multidrug efflux pump subunit AcrB/ABC-type multidrug transport system ATPase subunit